MPDLMDGSMALVVRGRLIAAQPGHGIAVYPAPVLVEELGTFLDDGRRGALAANAVIEVREEVDVESVIAAAPRLRSKGQVRVEVRDRDAIVCVEALPGNIVDDARNVDQRQIEAVLEECGTQDIELVPLLAVERNSSVGDSLPGHPQYRP